ncbi:ZIP family metal transporter [Halomonas sp. LBP4]|uniref:ZIP family metal transporter n=1 Tax=Halomonas sp. LBP4 TaxID=2044917 RepID=UPI000D76093F|nr:divalent cation transporter [Halomonas sp. LBP4]PXX99268.1 divalent cation transporter [Halomonas sp. LBP4]
MTVLPMAWALGLAWMAGLSIPAGALVSSNVVLRNACLRMKLDSFVSYFGGGALLAAIALVLMPRGIEHTSVLSVVLAFGTGGLVFWQFSAWAKRTQNSASQFMGMLLDFFPEAILLGVLAASGSNMVYLLAGLIALQNMPEGFSAYHEMRENMSSRSCLLMIFLAVSMVGPLAAWLGFVWFSSSEFMLAMILLFCSGGILYLIFEDIAPRAHSESNSFPAVGAYAGFCWAW